MHCTRCQGLQCREYIPGYGRWWWKCVACGDRVDAVILRNRAEQEAAVAAMHETQQRDLEEWARWLERIPVTTTQ